MELFLMISLIIVSLLIVVFVLLQPGKSDGLSGSLTGGAEQLFGKTKARGMELFLQRGTAILASLFFALAFALAYFY